MTNKEIRLLVLDVDGTLTDGTIYFSAEGEAMKGFSVKDGHGIIHLLPKTGIIPVIITGRESQLLLKRAEEMKITEIHQGIGDKVSKLYEVIEKYGVTLEQVAYIGDDINDLPCMKLCGLTAAPADAVDEVKNYVDFVSSKNGGAGAVREFVEYLCLLALPQMKQAFAYLDEIKGKDLDVGRTELDGDALYANVDAYETKVYENTRFESHEKYVDIQYMISGTETLEVVNRNVLEISEGYDVKRDLTFYSGDYKGKQYTITDGEFLIFRPEDAHRPGIATKGVQQNVKKMVIKVKIAD